jgi:tight adherence protein C
MSLLLVLGLGLLAAAVYLVAEVATAGARQRTLAVQRAARYGQFRRPGLDPAKFRERVLAPATVKLARLALKLNPRTTIESVESKLLNAGLGRKVSPTAFLAAKTASGGVGAFVGVVFAAMAAAPFASLVFVPLSFLSGFMLPSFVVALKARSRRDQIRAQLPDALDLLSVSVEAGLGFDGALAKLTEHLEGPLIDELEFTLSEMRIGETRHDALKKLAERAATPEVGHFTRAIIQADQLGISLGRILRLQAADTRDRRQAAAEEKAMKAPIKMLFPTVAFIFPALFIVVLGPAFLHLSKYF